MKIEKESADSGVFDQRIPRPHRLASILRPIAFHPIYVDICSGSINAALMLSQILYWTPRCGPESEGWFYKTQQQWFEELRLTRTQQDNARSILRDCGFVEEQLQSCRAGTVKHFRANLLKIEDALDELRIPRTVCLKQAIAPETVCLKQAEAIAANKQRYKETETTTETTKCFSESLTPSDAFELNSEPPKKKSKSEDPRHALFRENLEKFWAWKNADLTKFAWSAADAKQLSELLKRWPALTLSQFKSWLMNYSNSDDITPSKTPRQFLSFIHNYASGARDKYHNPKEEQNV